MCGCIREAFEKFMGNRLPGCPRSPQFETQYQRARSETGGIAWKCERYVDIFVTDGILSVSSVGTSHLLSLNNDDTIAKELKRVYMALLLREAGITRIAENAISLAAYGSIARGSYDERSDIDILVLGDENDVDFGLFAEIEACGGHEVHVMVVPYYRWEEMKQRRDALAMSIIAHHILFRGAEL